MGMFWKVMAGAAIGIGAIAAAPFTGGGSVLAGVSLASSLAGAGTIAAATAAGVAGAATGAMVGKNEKEEREEEINNAWHAGATIMNMKCQEKITELGKRLSANNEFSRKLVGLFAVGIAVANADGYISAEEMDEIDGLVAGISALSLPEHIKQAIADLRKNPPSLDIAMQKARQYGVTADEIDDVIVTIAMVDGYLDPAEERLIAQWKEMRPQYC